MRLIRITGNEEGGLIDNDFQANILIKENSKIALDSLTTEISPSAITIGASNDTITFSLQVGAGNSDPKTATLTHGVYGGESATRTYEQLLTEMQDQFQKSLSTFSDTGVGKMIGSQYKVHYNGQSKTEIELRQTPQVKMKQGTVGNWKFVGCDFLNADARGEITRTTGDAGALDSYMYNTVPLAKGGGCLKARMANATAGGGVNASDAGVIIGLSRTNPATWVSPELDGITDINWGIQLVQSGSVYETIEDGVKTVSTKNAAVGATYSDNDIIQLGYNNDTVNFSVIHTDGSIEELDSVDVETGYTNDYYPIIVFLGSSDNTDAGYTSIGTVRHYGDPYHPDTVSLPRTFQSEVDVGANNSMRYNSANERLYYNLPSLAFANYLGYNEVNSGQIFWGNAYGYMGENAAYPSNEIVDNFIVELLNLELNSYDGLSQQRKNYLSTIPSAANDENIVSYKANFPIFLNLKNEKPFTLRNIKARILTFGGSAVQTRGQTTITLLVKDGMD